MLVSVPSIDNIIFQRFFECVWKMEAEENWNENYEKKKLIEEIMTACGYADGVSFIMLCRAHDIIYDRD